MEKTAKSKMTVMTSGLGGSSSQSQLVDRSYMRRVVYVAPDKDLVSLTEHRDKTGGTTIPKHN
jgi:glutamate racemase